MKYTSCDMGPNVTLKRLRWNNENIKCHIMLNLWKTELMSILVPLNNGFFRLATLFDIQTCSILVTKKII